MTAPTWAMLLVLKQLAFTDVAGPLGIDLGGTKFAGAAFSDVDGDGCVDAVINTFDSAVMTHLFFGRCALGFSDVTATQAPGLLTHVTERSVLFADFDNDGRPELVRNSDTVVQLFHNRGPGNAPLYGATPVFERLTDAGSGPNDALNSETLGAADVNADGWLDLIVESTGVDLWVQAADAGLRFERRFDAGFPVVQWSGDYGATLDFDVDGWPDFLIRSDVIGQLWLNDGGAFAPSTSFVEVANNNDKGGVAACDFDSDGRFDIFWSDQGLKPNEVWTQGSTRTFTPRGVPGGGARRIEGAACGDLDNDGRPDLVLTSDAGAEVWRNTTAAGGALAFTRDQVLPSRGLSAVMVDYDRDGDLDVFLNAMPKAALWRNDLDAGLALWVEVKTGPRDELGASAHLEACDGGRLSGERELSGGQGRGNQTEPVLQLALPQSADLPVVVSVLHVGGARSRHAVVPSASKTRRLEARVRGVVDDVTACAPTEPPPEPEPLVLHVCGACSSGVSPLLLAALAWVIRRAGTRRPVLKD